MTNNDMERAIKWIRLTNNLDYSDDYIMGILKMDELTETEIRYCYVLATGKNMEV